MKIEKLTIENLFAYFGRHELDLSVTSKEKPIVVIMGRNGYGKTSLLKSLWLLFLGPEHRLLQEVGYRAHPIGSRQVLLGTDDERYLGAFNTKARAERKRGVRFGISATITEDDGTQALIERYWEISGRELIPAVTVEQTGRTLADGDAEAFLARRFPPAIIPYFFFDGEQIQEVAEGRDGERTEHIERLLGLRHAMFFQDQLNDVAKDLGRAHLQADVKDEMKKSESELEINAAEIRQVQSKIDDANVEAENLKERLTILNRRIENISRGSGKFDSERAKHKINEIRDTFEARRDEFISSFMPILPLFGDFDFLHSALDKAR